MSASDRPLDYNVREAIRAELDRSAFVEAGAGTGKSTTLVSRILSVVTNDSDPVPLRDVAAITFTERAAGELRNKVRDALLARARADSSHGDVRTALLDVDVAIIGTIHSFALTILREHVVAAGLPLGFEVAESYGGAKARSRRMVEVWADRLPEEDCQHLIDAGISLVQLRPLSEGLDAMRTRIDSSSISPPALIDIEAQAPKVAAGLSGVIREALAGCANGDDRLALHIEGPVSRLCDVVANLNAASVIGLRGEWAEVWSKTFKPGGIGSNKAWESQGGAKAVRDRLKEWEQPVQALFDAPVENALRRAVAIAWDELDRKQAERVAAGDLEFDDLLLLCRSLLRDNSEVRKMVAQRFRVVLVDEFQDTDPVQWEIIRLVTSDPEDEDAVPRPGRLVVVGDPKQSIYSFRGADIRTYLAAGETFSGERYSLTTNFRSVEPIVRWVNEAFGQLFVSSGVQPSYLPLQSHHAPSSATSVGPAVVVLRDPAPPEVDSEDTDEVGGRQESPSSRHLEPRLVATAIRRAIDDGWQITEPTPDRTQRNYQRTCTYRDVAVLVPSRSGVPDLLDAFDGLGIPFRSADIQIVLDRPVVSGLVSALRVLNNPDDQFSLWWTLKSPLFGCADDELLRYRKSGGYWRIGRVQDEGGRGAIEGALDVLAQLRDKWVAPQPAGVLDALVESTRLFETLVLVPRGAFDSDCVRMLQGHARSWQDAGGVGLDDYLIAVEQLANNTSRATLAEPDDRDDDAVRISTIHSAKGLEFPIVALAGMSIGPPNFSEIVGICFDLGIEFNVTGFKTAGYARWKDEECVPREQAELLRLLYVACTRARDHLIVSVLGDDKARSALIREAVLAADALQMDTPLETVAATANVLPRQLAPLPNDWHERLDRVRLASAVSWVASPSRSGKSFDADQPDRADQARTETEAEEGDRDSDSADAFARRARDGRPVGRALHAALDWLFGAAGPPSRIEIDRATRRAVVEEGILDAHEDVRQRVGAAMSSAIAAEAFGAQRRWTELYLAAPQEGEEVRLVEGYADLVFDTEDGLVLVDHKSDAVLPGESLAHYQAQLDGYADLLRRATGRPVVRQVLLHVPGNTATVVELTTGARN